MCSKLISLTFLTLFCSAQVRLTFDPETCRKYPNQKVVTFGPRFPRTCGRMDERRTNLMYMACVCKPGYIQFGYNSKHCVLERDCPSVPSCSKRECLIEHKPTSITIPQRPGKFKWLNGPPAGYYCAPVGGRLERGYDGFCRNSY